MEILIVLLSIPILLIVGFAIAWICDFLWFRWLDFVLWLTHRRAPRPNPLPVTVPVVPQTTLPIPPEVKRKEELDSLDINDPEFTERFGEWLTKAREENEKRLDPRVPRFERERQDP